jgi:hypothetical protein
MDFISILLLIINIKTLTDNEQLIVILTLAPLVIVYNMLIMLK